MTSPQELRTKRLLLRPFQDKDVTDALAYRNDNEFARFLPHIPQPFTLQDAEAFVRQNMSEPWDRSPTFAIVLDGQLIGTVSFEIDREARAAMLGYAIGRAWWGRGITVEAAQAAINWSIQTFDLIRIWASTDVGNIRSQRVLDKLGFKLEGLKAAERNDEQIDEVIYGLTLG